jgi:tubulin-specific chaperone D
VSSSLVNFVQELAPEAGVYPQVSLTTDLVEQLKRNFSNNNIFIPLLQTFNVLLEGNALEPLKGNDEGEKQWVCLLLTHWSGYLSFAYRLRGLLSVATRNIPRIKNVSRIQASMRVYVQANLFHVKYSRD